ncbi:protein transport protein Sec9p [[Candida] railenensis]|uniref:Protein transport protein Sec9p n=1 Tax=[Candida] railenensis TaxID=45579 RepID=A0A9P0QRQ9_9ASCO|nr:protein transport protein Sec9p [[Candida] railenensis]
MGIKKMFKKKDPTEDELRQELTNAGITTKSNVGNREEKFGAFRQYAQERQSQKPGFTPVNPYANVNQGAPGSNPYAENQQGGQQQGNPYGGGQPEANPYGSGAQSQQSQSPYGSSQNARANPYGGQSQQSNPYGGQSQQPNPYGGQSQQSNPYGGQSQQPNPYGAPPRANGSGASAAAAASPYGIQTNRPYDRGPRRRDFDEETLDLNSPSMGIKSVNNKKKPSYDTETLDLNEAADDDDDLNVVLDELPEETQVNSEDEEVENIKQDIRFVKQESLSSTRNTLSMAQQADASATNTMGMLGSQSERLYNAEQNLLLADTQTNIAQDKVEQLRRLNRSIFIPATSVNPFNKKSKLRAQEARLKTEKAQEKYMRDTNRQGVYESEMRIKEGLNSTNSDLYQKYKGDQSLEAAKRYQFENDSEDDEMEKELASNLDQIALYSKKLKASAHTMGKEVDSQNDRLRKIEDDADRLDINVHLNSTRLSNIR